MNLVTKLLEADAGKITARPTGEKEIKRLSEIIGEPFVIKYQALECSVHDDIAAFATDDKGVMDQSLFGKLYVIEGVVDPSFKDEKLMSKFGVSTPEDLVDKILLPGESLGLADEISAISGFGDTAKDVEKLKNSSRKTRKRS